MAALYPGSVQNPDYCGIVNERHYRRLGSLLEEARQLGARVVPLGLSGQATPTRDDGQRRLALHAIVDPPEGSRALSEELRSEEHTSELQSLMRISYAVFCLKKKKQPH